MGASHLDLHSEGLSVSGAPRGPALPLLSPLRPGATVESVVSALSLPTPPTPLRVLWGSVVPTWKCMRACEVCVRVVGVRTGGGGHTCLHTGRASLRLEAERVPLPLARLPSRYPGAWAASVKPVQGSIPEV